MNAMTQHRKRVAGGTMVALSLVFGVLLAGGGHVALADHEAGHPESMMIEQLGLVSTNDGPAAAGDEGMMIEQLGLVPTNDGPALASAPTLVGSGPERETVALESLDGPVLVGSGPEREIVAVGGPTLVGSGEERETVAVVDDAVAVFPPGITPF